ncbi:hypothetical protein ACJJTC_007138 [Scirpophaga incertulas]
MATGNAIMLEHFSCTNPSEAASEWKKFRNRFENFITAYYEEVAAYVKGKRDGPRTVLIDDRQRSALDTPSPVTASPFSPAFPNARASAGTRQKPNASRSNEDV